MASSPSHQPHSTRRRQTRGCSPDDVIGARERGSRRRRAESPPVAFMTSPAAHAHQGQSLRYLTQLSGHRWHSCELPATWQVHHTESPRARRDSDVDASETFPVAAQEEEPQPYALILRNTSPHGVEPAFIRRRGSSSSCGSPTSRPTLVLAFRSDNIPQLKIRTTRKTHSSKTHGRRAGQSESGTTSTEATPTHKGARVKGEGHHQARPGPDSTSATARDGPMHLRRRLFRNHSSQTEEDAFTETDSAQGDWCNVRSSSVDHHQRSHVKESPPTARRQWTFQYPCPCRRSQEAQQYRQYQHEYLQQQRWSEQTSDVDSSFVSLGAQSGEASSVGVQGKATEGHRRRSTGHSPRHGRSPRHREGPRPSPTSPRDAQQHLQDAAESHGSTSTCAGRDTGYSETSSSSAEDSSSAWQKRSSSSGALASASENEDDDADQSSGSSTDGQETSHLLSEGECLASEPRQGFVWPPTIVRLRAQPHVTLKQGRTSSLHEAGHGGGATCAPDEETSERQDTSSITEEEEDTSELWSTEVSEEVSREVSRGGGEEEDDASTATNHPDASGGRPAKATQFLRPTIEIDRSDILHTAKPEIDEGDFGVGLTYQKMSEAEFVARLSIHEAARTGDLHVIKLLLKSDHKRMETVDERGWTPILLAAANGHAEVVKYLAVEGADVAALDPTSYTAMHLAAMNGHNACLEVLLKVGADVDSVTADGFTPLHLAALNNYADCVQTLLSWGANLGLEDALGRTVQDMVEEYSLDDVSALLSSLWSHIDKYKGSGKLNGQLGSSRKKSTRKLIQMAAASLGKE
ncbi:uncharacterized protein LOC135392060 [Ornithodoros turicata]|uniref:uncharacterized protein LOC135392060 n=1 Tax=Ornithodoros turicata TaxID=34597 RepID=UPI00313896ED